MKSVAVIVVCFFILVKAEVSFFVPDSFVPITTFRGIESTQIVVPIRKEILKFLLPFGMKLAIHKDNATVYIEPLAIDTIANTVEGVISDSLIGGIVTVVSPLLINDFPVVTHWDQSLNSGRGGFRLGASDELGVIDIDPVTGQKIYKSYIWDHYWVDSNICYIYNVRKYALFDNDADVPSYERYVGENYAIYKIADRYAIWFSDEVLRSTGFPVIHRNYPLQSPLLHNVPVFQVIHAWLIATEQDKSSLATFLVPPFWPESMPQEGYPVLFSGHYDINSNSFVENGPIIIQVVGEVLNSGKGSALGILWNGGGASGPGTMQRSAYDNAAILFEMARDSLKINPNAIITFGGSRGGFTALAMAANPYHNNYRAVYALAYGPPVKGGEHLQRFQNTCYPRLMHCNDVTTGYSYSWRLGWKDPITGMSGRELYRYNLVGTIDYAYMDSFLFPASPFHLQALKDKGTRVLLSIGTHDAFMPLPLYFKYMDGLQKHEIPVRFEIFYRWGHTVSASIPDYLTYCLESILNGDTLNFPIGTFHYRRLNNDNPNECEEFFPAYQPIVLEAPKACAKPETVTISIIGDEGLGYDLLLWKINDSSLEKNQSVLKEFIAQRMQGVLPDSKFVVELLASADLDSGYYLYELFFSRDNINWIQIPSEYVPQPGEKGPPILQIFETEPMLSGYDVANILGKENRGWGLSSEHIDLPVTIGEVKQPVFNSRLFQNYPNPFNSSTIIYFSIPCQSRVMLKVFDKLGRRIATIMDKRLEGGRYSVPYDTKDLASGVYLCRLTTATFSQTRTMIVLK